MWILLLKVAELKQKIPEKFPQFAVCGESKKWDFFLCLLGRGESGASGQVKIEEKD